MSMGPLPMPNMEAAKEFFAMLAAGAAALEAWLTFRDRGRASRASTEAYQEAESSTEDDSVIQQLSEIIPVDTWRKLGTRLKECSDRFNEMLDNPDKYFEDQINRATIPFKRCICENLAMILEIYGELPTSAQRRLWKSYDCPTLLKDSAVNRRTK